jgi:phosphoenolpyruvate carboxykinase (ATP)
MQTAILTDKLEWEAWEMLPGAMIPTKESVNAILPGYYEKYDPKLRGNMDRYHGLLKDRFQHRRDYLMSSDLQEKPEVQAELIKTLEIK